MKTVKTAVDGWPSKADAKVRLDGESVIVTVEAAPTHHSSIFVDLMNRINAELVARKLRSGGPPPFPTDAGYMTLHASWYLDSKRRVLLSIRVTTDGLADYRVDIRERQVTDTTYTLVPRNPDDDSGLRVVTTDHPF